MSEEERFADNLRLLNDVLATTAFGQHYTLWGGLLLGWAREGRVLPWDVGDADFYYVRQHRSLLRAAMPALAAAGFWPHRAWFDSRGTIVSYTFKRDDDIFDFFEFEVRGAEAYYWTFLPMRGRRAWVELTGVVPFTGEVVMEFLGRRWRVPADHDAFLAACYGDWRTPIPKDRWHLAGDGMKLAGQRLWTHRHDPVVLVPPHSDEFACASFA